MKIVPKKNKEIVTTIQIEICPFCGEELEGITWEEHINNNFYCHSETKRITLYNNSDGSSDVIFIDRDGDIWYAEGRMNYDSSELEEPVPSSKEVVIGFIKDKIIQLEKKIKEIENL